MPTKEKREPIPIDTESHISQAGPPSHLRGAVTDRRRKGRPMMVHPDYIRNAYGIRPGDRVGILIDDDFEMGLLIDTLERFSCKHVVLDPLQDMIELSSVVAESGIRLILTSPSRRRLACGLPACIACAKILTDSCI